MFDRYWCWLLPRLFLVVMSTLVEVPHGIQCDLGDAITAFRAPLDPEAACEPWQLHCWQAGTVADGPGRGDAFLTILWADRDPRQQRLHASYVRHASSGELCELPSALSSTTYCHDDGCFRYIDSCEDRVGGVVMLPEVDGMTRLNTCLQAATRGYCGKLHISEFCPDSCGRCRSSQACISAKSMLSKFQQFARWGWYSQWNQDSVIHLLLVHPGGLRTADSSRFFVEFGFRPLQGIRGMHSNTEYLRRVGWRGVTFDGDPQHSDQARGVFIEQVTADNVVDVFTRYEVPHEPGFVSIDIDSCDIWVFLSLTKRFRPRVVQIEYNRHLPFDSYLALDCSQRTLPPVRTSKRRNRWLPLSESDIYGASVKAIQLAAAARGYVVLWLERCFDVFLVRSDLICSGESLPDLEMFRHFTAVDGGCPDPWGWFAVHTPARERWRRQLNVTDEMFEPWP